MERPGRLLVLGTVLLASLAAGCRTDDSRALEATITGLEDIRETAAGTWEALARSTASDPAARARWARAVGRLRSRDLAVLLEHALEAEPDEGVQVELLFALGQLAAPDSMDLLARHLLSPRPAVRARAAEALGKLGKSSVLEVLLPRLNDPDAAVRGAALLAIARLRKERAGAPDRLPASPGEPLVEAILRRLADPDQGVRWRAAYALAQVDEPGREPALEAATRSLQPWVRLFAVRGLERVEANAAARLRVLSRLLEQEANPHVAAAAARALGSLGVRGAASPLLAALAGDAGPAGHHRRAAALEALSRLARRGQVPEDRGQRALSRYLEDPSPRVRLQAFRLLASLSPGPAASRLELLARSARPDHRRLAASALSALPTAQGLSLLTALAGDASPSVASQALQQLADLGKAGGVTRQRALQVLSRPDVAVRATALEALRATGRAEDLEAIAMAYQRSPGPGWVEARTAAVRAAAAVAREAAVLFLRAWSGDPAPAVRQVAADALSSLGLESPARAPARGRPSSIFPARDQDASRLETRPRVRLSTSKGEIVMELLRDQAPHHVESFLARARSGFYDGLRFHRVVSGFVVQGLDPRGDGWGTGGGFLRDEINPVPFLAGTIGMPNAGPDTGGCQIFITYAPAPRLDGRYTVFGRVVEGMDVLDALDRGDRCLRVRPERRPRPDKPLPGRGARPARPSQ
ncbi:MAG: HEAT repeat domain-containing protein [Acidobacteriota bacterium]